MAEPKNSVPNDPRSTPNIGRTEPRSTALSVPDATPVTAQRHCREQRTYIKTGYTAHHHRKILTLFDTMKTQDVSSVSLMLYGTEIAVCEQGVEGWLRTVAKANEEKNEKRARRKK